MMKQPKTEPTFVERLLFDGLKEAHKICVEEHKALAAKDNFIAASAIADLGDKIFNRILEINPEMAYALRNRK